MSLKAGDKAVVVIPYEWNEHYALLEGEIVTITATFGDSVLLKEDNLMWSAHRFRPLDDFCLVERVLLGVQGEER